MKEALTRTLKDKEKEEQHPLQTWKQDHAEGQLMGYWVSQQSG